MVKKNSRDLVGYGEKGKKISWPNNAKLALQIAVSYTHLTLPTTPYV